MISNTLRHFSRRSALARRSVAQFHASAANNDDAKDAAPVDDSTGNDGIFGALFGNPYTSIPLCGLGVMSATATDVSALLSFFFLIIVRCRWIRQAWHHSRMSTSATVVRCTCFMAIIRIQNRALVTIRWT